MAGPIETRNEGGVDVSVPENRKGRARVRIICTPWGGSGGGVLTGGTMVGSRIRKAAERFRAPSSRSPCQRHTMIGFSP